MVLTLLWSVPTLQVVGLITVVAATFIPYLWIPVLMLLAGLIVITQKRARRISIFVTALVAVGLLVPTFGSFAQPGPAGDLQYISINAQYGRASVEQLQKLVRPSTDLIVIQEFTPEMAERMQTVGLERDFPHIIAHPRSNSPAGAAVYAREPIELLDVYDGHFTNQVILTSEIDDVRFTVANIHVIPPTMGAQKWDADSRAIAAWVEPYVGSHFVALGDFNAINQHSTMHYFYDLGLTDPQSGIAIGRSLLSTWQPTWPVGMTIPPFARIDHALVPQHAATGALRYATVAGTDHKAVIGGLFKSR